MARKNEERDQEGRSTESGRRGRGNKVYESGTYGDFDDGGYDDDEEEDYAFESGYDDEEYADYDTSFDEDDGSWGRRQEQFEGVTRDERRRKAQGGVRKRGTRDHSREFDEGYDSEYETEFNLDDVEGDMKRGRGLASMPRGRARRITTKTTKKKRPSNTKGSARKDTTTKTETRAGSGKRASASRSSLRTRSNGNRKGSTIPRKTSRRRAGTARKISSAKRAK